jgi:hypothetical protein
MSKKTLFLAATLLVACFCFADTFNPGDQIIATFTTKPNTADLLFFFNNDPLTVSGAPVLTLTLYNGASTLGTIVAPPLPFGGNSFFGNLFQKVGSPLILPPGLPHSTVDFTSINNGTIAGELIWTISGGSLSGFNTADFVLQIANTSNDNLGYSPLPLDITSQVTLVNVPEPSSLMLLGTSVLGLLGMIRRKLRS